MAFENYILPHISAMPLTNNTNDVIDYSEGEVFDSMIETHGEFDYQCGVNDSKVELHFSTFSIF